MSRTAEILGASRSSYVRVVGAVSAAHFVSHYYIILLAPLLPFVRAEYAVSYTEIGLAFAVFNIVSAALQTPAGFLVDRLGARALLVAGLLIGAGVFIVVGLIDSFWGMVADRKQHCRDYNAQHSGADESAPPAPLALHNEQACRRDGRTEHAGESMH